MHPPPQLLRVLLTSFQFQVQNMYSLLSGLFRFTQVPQARGHPRQPYFRRGTQRLLEKRIGDPGPRLSLPTVPALAVACQPTPLIFSSPCCQSLCLSEAPSSHWQSERVTSGCLPFALMSCLSVSSSFLLKGNWMLLWISLE